MTDWTKLAGAGALALLLTTPALAQGVGAMSEEDYRAWDTDADTMLSLPEFEGGMRTRGSFGMWDEDQSGTIDEAEYSSAIMRTYDMDRDGMLNADEQAAFMEDDGMGMWMGGMMEMDG